MDDYALKLQLVHELKETLRVKQLNLELMDALESSILFVISNEDKQLPNLPQLQALLRRVKVLYDELYPTLSEQPDMNNRKRNKTNVTVLLQIRLLRAAVVARLFLLQLGGLPVIVAPSPSVFFYIILC